MRGDYARAVAVNIPFADNAAGMFYVTHKHQLPLIAEPHEYCSSHDFFVVGMTPRFAELMDWVDEHNALFRHSEIFNTGLVSVDDKLSKADFILRFSDILWRFCLDRLVFTK